MHEFIDLKGASGAIYRFQHISNLANLPAIAGNFVYVRGNGAHRAVVCCGTDETLLNAAARWPLAVQSHRADAVFVRRNISWRTRAIEHDDLVNGQKPVMIVAPEFEKQSPSNV